jgi:hypothetical protein
VRGGILATKGTGKIQGKLPVRSGRAGGYRFGDYWRMGLLLELVIALVAIHLIMIFWPLGIG